MAGFMGTARRKIAAGAMGAALLGVGLGFGAHAASQPTQTRPASDVATASTPAAPTTAAIAPAATSTAAAPTSTATVEQPTADTQAATVGQVDTQPAPAPAPAPDTATATPDVPAGATVEPDGHTYAPMPSPTMEKLPGEPGYNGQPTPPAP